MEERKESSQTSTLEKQSSKEDSTVAAEEKYSKPDDPKFVEKSSPAKIEEKPTLIDNDESTVRYIQVYTVSVKDHTVFFITHRLASIKSADIIVMMDKGTVAEEGTHEELMARKGLYYTLYKQQDSQI